MNSEILDRLPPHNIDAEKGVLGSLILDERLCDEVGTLLRPEDFYADAHQKLYGHLLAMHDAGGRIDATLLLERLRSGGDLEVIGGPAYLAEIVSTTPHAGNAAYYAKIVRDKAVLRSVIHAATEILRAAYDPGQEPHELLDTAAGLLQQAERDRGQELASAAELALEIGDHVDAVCERGSHLGVPTGLSDFDERIGGLFAGELIVLAARPGVGKSALAAQIADYVAHSGRLTYIATLEMTGLQLAVRTVCSLSGVNGKRLRTGRLTGDDRQALVRGMAQFSRRKLFVDRRGDMTVETLARTLRRLTREGLKLAVVDYLGLLTPSDARMKRHEQVSHQTRVFKRLARELGIPLLVLCQLNRNAEDDVGRPRLSHLRESGSVEQDADTVLFIHRPEGGIRERDPNDKRKTVTADWPAELIVAKQRSGVTGRIKLDWEPAYTRFSCFDTPQQEFGEFTEFSATGGSDAF